MAEQDLEDQLGDLEEDLEMARDALHGAVGLLKKYAALAQHPELDSVAAILIPQFEGELEWFEDQGEG